jgi:DNA invertase Pin-like site-specific DNA recombinase
MKRAVLYLRLSTVDQTTANQDRELREIASRSGLDVVKVYKDHGISGANGRDKRPGFDTLSRDATKRQFDVVMAWSVDRLDRSLQDLVTFLSELTRSALTSSCIRRAPIRGRQQGRPCSR